MKLKLNIYSITKSCNVTIKQLTGDNNTAFDYSVKNTGGTVAYFQGTAELEQDVMLSVGGYIGIERADLLNIKFQNDADPNNKILVYVNCITK